jgi:hypothetical protein
MYFESILSTLAQDKKVNCTQEHFIKVAETPNEGPSRTQPTTQLHLVANSKQLHQHTRQAQPAQHSQPSLSALSSSVVSPTKTHFAYPTTNSWLLGFPLVLLELERLLQKGSLLVRCDTGRIQTN